MFLWNKSSNVVKTIINLKITISGWYKPFPVMGGKHGIVGKPPKKSPS